MRKTRAHPPTDHKTEDLRHYRRVIREAVRALDELEAPRRSGGVELAIAGRIRLLHSNLLIETNLLRAALHDALAGPAVALDGVHSSAAAVSAPDPEPATSVGVTSPTPLRRSSMASPRADTFDLRYSHGDPDAPDRCRARVTQRGATEAEGWPAVDRVFECAEHGVLEPMQVWVRARG
jgi:hypothetical protein